MIEQQSSALTCNSSIDLSHYTSLPYSTPLLSPIASRMTTKPNIIPPRIIRSRMSKCRSRKLMPNPLLPIRPPHPAPQPKDKILGKRLWLKRMVRPYLSHLVQNPIDVVPSAVVTVVVYPFASDFVGEACDGKFGCVFGYLWVYGMEECLERGGRVLGGECHELVHARVEDVC